MLLSLFLIFFFKERRGIITFTISNVENAIVIQGRFFSHRSIAKMAVVIKGTTTNSRIEKRQRFLTKTLKSFFRHSEYVILNDR